MLDFAKSLLDFGSATIGKRHIYEISSVGFEPYYDELSFTCY